MAMKLFIIASFLLLNTAWGFSLERCDSIFKGHGSPTGFIITSTSTTQFSSSFRECSMIGIYQNDEKKEEKYIKKNFDQIKMAASMGDGEVLDSLYGLSRCKTWCQKDLFKNYLKTNYSTLFLSKNILINNLKNKCSI